MLAFLFILLSTKTHQPCAGQTIINDIKHLIPLHSDHLGFFFFFKPEALNNHLLNDLSTNNRQVSSIEKVVT